MTCAMAERLAGRAPFGSARVPAIPGTDASPLPDVVSGHQSPSDAPVAGPSPAPDRLRTLALIVPAIGVGRPRSGLRAPRLTNGPCPPLAVWATRSAQDTADRRAARPFRSVRPQRWIDEVDPAVVIEAIRLPLHTEHPTPVFGLGMSATMLIEQRNVGVVSTLDGSGDCLGSRPGPVRADG